MKMTRKPPPDVPKVGGGGGLICNKEGCPGRTPSKINEGGSEKITS